MGHDRYVVTVLAPALTAETLAAVTHAIAQTGAQADPFKSIAIPASAGVEGVQSTVIARDPQTLRASFLQLSHELGIDIAIQPESEFGRPRRLIVFDMDSTLIQAEIIDELAKMKGVGDEVSRVTSAAMRGELDFQQSFTRRLSLLRGLPETRVMELLDRVPITPGAEVLISTLRRHGYKTGILSGGFTFFGRYLQARLQIDYLHANVLDIQDGLVTGQVVPPIMDGTRKAEMLRQIAQNEGIPLGEAIAVGDGANDLPMLNLAGMGIAYRAKPIVRQNAQHSISTLGLDAILYLLGLSQAAAQ